MLISEPLPFVTAFLDALDAALKAHKPLAPGLSPDAAELAGLLPDGDSEHQYRVLGAV